MLQTSGGHTLDFIYDNQGRPMTLVYDGTAYTYMLNLQGDVIALLNSSGGYVAKYVYDAWGKVLSVGGSNTTIANANPLRYRGYYYDTESGLYYLQSRYYDPVVKRFINADGYISTGQGFIGYNMFVYCTNNPVNFIDPSGYLPDWVYKYFGTEWNYYQWLQHGAYVPAKKPGPNSGYTASTSNPNRRPNTGEPDSTYRAPNGDTRTYGPDGKPVHDYDHSDHGNPGAHPHDENGGHHHDWVNGKRGPAYVISWEQVLGGVIVAGCTIGAVVVTANDAFGIGVLDDFLIGPLGVGIEKGLSMVMS